MPRSRPSRDINLRQSTCSRRVLPLLPTISQARLPLPSRLLAPPIHEGWHLQGAHRSPTQAIDLGWGGTLPHSKASRPYCRWLSLVHPHESRSSPSHLPGLTRAYITIQKLCAAFMQLALLAERVRLQAACKLRWISQNSLNSTENAHGVSVSPWKLDINLCRWVIPNRAEVEVFGHRIKRVSKDLSSLIHRLYGAQ